jgi:uncharacterized protein (TIGR03000 family)
MSKGLEPGRTYRYEIRAELEQDGQTLEQTKVADLAAGSSAELQFDFGVETRLTLNVPEDAIVTLAGSPTQMTGPRRVFVTTKLAAGERWPDYTVRVALDREGRELMREQTISLVGGESQELTIDFGSDKIAAAH